MIRVRPELQSIDHLDLTTKRVRRNFLDRIVMKDWRHRRARAGSAEGWKPRSRCPHGPSRLRLSKPSHVMISSRRVRPRVKFNFHRNHGLRHFFVIRQIMHSQNHYQGNLRHACLRCVKQGSGESAMQIWRSGACSSFRSDIGSFVRASAGPLVSESVA